MPHFAVSAVGADRPGIVAAVSGVLVDHGCNLEDTSMSILRGHFAMMLVVAGPNGLEPATLEEALGGIAGRFDLVVAVRPIDDAVPSSPEGDAWNVAVYGADQPGIVHQVASVLAESEVNISDLTTRLIGDADHPVYAMILDVVLPVGMSGEEFSSLVEDRAGALGVECSVHPSEADIL